MGRRSVSWATGDAAKRAQKRIQKRPKTQCHIHSLTITITHTCTHTCTLTHPTAGNLTGRRVRGGKRGIASVMRTRRTGRGAWRGRENAFSWVSPRLHITLSYSPFSFGHFLLSFFLSLSFPPPTEERRLDFILRSFGSNYHTPSPKVRAGMT